MKHTSLLTSALTGKVAPYKRGFGPFPPDVFHIPFPGGACSDEEKPMRPNAGASRRKFQA